MRGLGVTMSALLALLLGGVAAVEAGSQPLAQLTAEEERRAVAIARGDPRVRSIVGDGRVAVDRLLPWSTDGTRSTLVGADLTLRLSGPVSLERDWPVVDWHPTEPTYDEATVHYRMVGATGLNVQVIFDPPRVVGFEPYGGEIDQDSAYVPSATAGSATEDGEPAWPVAVAGLAFACAVLVTVVAFDRIRQARFRRPAA